MSRFPYQFFDQYIFRSPLFSLNDFLENTDCDEISDESLKKICADPVFKEAVYLASPYLYNEIEKWINSGEELSAKKYEKLKNAILKYYSRMSTRCTPFGLFSGVGLGRFEDHAIDHFNRKCTRDTKPDMHFLVRLSQDLVKLPEVRSRLLYFPNTSIYAIGRRIRYVEYEYIEDQRQYIISTALKSPELEKILGFVREGKTIDQMISILVNDEISSRDALEFIEELIDNQILVSELEPNVSGDDFLRTLIAILKKIGTEKQEKALIAIQEKLDGMDHKIGNSSQIYKETEDLMKTLGITYEQKFLFQTDLYFQDIYRLPVRWKRELKTAIAFLNKITLRNKETIFENFKKAFRDRFQEEEVSLAYVMDTEIGIGYKQNDTAKGLHPYLDDLDIPQAKSKPELHISLDPVRLILNQKIQGCLVERQYSIRLSDEDFNDFEENWSDLPDTISFMAELFSDQEGEKLFLYKAGGNSAAELAARFCSEKSEIRNFTKAIADREKEMNPNEILAEIVHLPKARTGNVIRRPLLRDYEIPYLAGSALPEEFRIAIDDLYISLKNDTIVLRSKKLGKEIRPYLTNAHYYSEGSLPVYHFLSDLYSQNCRTGLGFSWGDLKNIYRFLPRVEYKNIILSKAQWRISKEEIGFLLPLIEDKKQFLPALKNWREKRQVPGWIQWIEWDNALPLNLENYDLARLFIQTVQVRESIVIEEFLHHKNEEFAYQFVLALYNNNK